MVGNGLHAREVLAEEEGLREAAVVVAAQVVDLAVLLRVGALVARPVHPFACGDELQAAVVARDRGRSVAVDVGGTFTIVGRRFVLRVGVEGVLEGRLQAGELRRLVGHHVVVAGRVRDAPDVVVAAVEDFSRREDEVVRARGRAHAAHAAEGDLAEIAGERQARFAAEEAFAVVRRARIDVEAVFELEGDGQAVAAHI